MTIHEAITTIGICNILALVGIGFVTGCLVTWWAAVASPAAKRYEKAHRRFEKMQARVDAKLGYVDQDDKP